MKPKTKDWGEVKPATYEEVAKFVEQMEKVGWDWSKYKLHSNREEWKKELVGKIEGMLESGDWNDMTLEAVISLIQEA